MAQKEEMQSLFAKWKCDVEELKSSLKTCNEDLDIDNVKYVAGVDVSYHKKENYQDPEEDTDKVHGCVALVVIKLPEKEVVYENCTLVHMDLPYISGYLGFREAEFFKEEFETMRRKCPKIVPQVLLVDGNGILHHEGFGSACHIGVAVNIPTVGVAKQLLLVDGLEKIDDHKTKISEQLNEPGDTFELIGKTRGVLGRALKSTNKSTKPLYISIGHNINLEQAVKIVHKCCIYRIPQPVRLADQSSRAAIKKKYKQHIGKCDVDWKATSKRFLEMEKFAN